MKKSVALIVAVIYFGGIAFIAFFGMELFVHNKTIYVESVEFTNEEIKVQQDGSKTLILTYYDGMAFFLKWKVLPEDASNRRVDFDYPKSDNYEITAQGLLIFYEPEPFTVNIRAVDGSNKKDSLMILIRTR